MLSKPVAVLLLVAALFGAGVGGAYLALKVMQPGDEDPLIDLPADGPSATQEPGASGPAPGTRKGGVRERVPSRGTSTAAGGGASAAGSTVPAGTSGPAAAAPGGASVTQTAGTPGTPPAQPKEPVFEEVEVPVNTLLAIKLQTGLSSETAKVEDRVEARTTKAVSVNGAPAIPVDTLVVGSVTLVKKGGAMGGQAEVDVKFHTLKIPHEPDAPIIVDVIPALGPSPAKGTKGRVAGGVAGGAAVGWLKGGLAGAITGVAVGGGAGVGARMVEGRQAAEVPAGAETQIQLRAPVLVTVQR